MTDRQGNDGVIDQLRRVADGLERTPHVLSDGVAVGSLAVALGTVEQHLDRTPGDLQDMLPDEPEVIPAPEITSRDRLLLIAAQLGMPSGRQDICDAESLVGSHMPGGDKAVIRQIELLTGKKWPKSRKDGAITLANAYRTSSLDLTSSLESEIESKSEQNNPVVVDQEPGLAIDHDTVLPEEPPVIAEEPAPTPSKQEEDPSSIVSGDIKVANVTSAGERKPAEKFTLSGLRHDVLTALAEQMGLESRVAKDLLSPSRKEFTLEQETIVETLRNLLYSRLDGGDGRVKAFALEQAVSAAEMKRLTWFLGIRLVNDDPMDRTAVSVIRAYAYPIGHLRGAAARNGHSGGPNQAEVDLLNGLRKLFVHAGDELAKMMTVR